METSELLTVAEAMKALGASRRSIYRSIERAEEAGHTVSTVMFARRLVYRKALETLRQHYYPYYSEAHQAKVQEWGRKGGTQKSLNARKKKK
jgi:hypothetical protein